MSNTENSTKRRNDDDAVDSEEEEKQLSLKLTTFTSYPKLALELRSHALSYAQHSTLKEYSQCSKLCNSEIQVHNIKAPEGLKFKETSYGIEVWFCYAFASSVKFFPSGSTMIQDVQNYVMKVFRYVKLGTTDFIFVDNLKRWPVEIMQISQLAKLKIFRVYLNKFVLNNFMRFAEKTDSTAKTLFLHDCDNFSEQVVLPSDIFKTTLMKNITSLYMYTKIQINKEDFVNSLIKDFHIKQWMDLDMIQGKLLKLIETNPAEAFNMDIVLSIDEARVYDLNILFPISLFPQRLIYGNHYVEIGSTISAQNHTAFPKKLMIKYIPRL